MTETGTTSYLDRKQQSERLPKMLEDFLKDHGFDLVEFGYNITLRDEPGMKAKMKKLDSKSSIASLMVKFSPDYITSYTSDTIKTIFFIDSKVSITPVFFPVQIDRIKKHSSKKYPGLNVLREDIGEIEREAWYVYNSFFPRDKVAIIMAAPYTPKLIVAEWVSNVKCLWCFNKVTRPPSPWDCEKCPIFKSDGTFGVTVNEFAGGSGTPHTNIHLGKMRSLKQFLEDEFEITIDRSWYSVIEDEVKSWGLNKPAGTVNWTQFNNVINDLKRKCPWLKNRRPEKIDKEQSRLEVYD